MVNKVLCINLSNIIGGSWHGWMSLRPKYWGLKVEPLQFHKDCANKNRVDLGSRLQCGLVYRQRCSMCWTTQVSHVTRQHQWNTQLQRSRPGRVVEV